MEPDTMLGRDTEDRWRNNTATLNTDDRSDLSEIYGTSEDVMGRWFDLIEKTADQILTLRDLESGDEITIESTNHTGEISLEFESETRLSDQNDVYQFSDLAEDEERTIHIVVDYDGAHTSEINVYIPYVTAIVIDGISLGDVETMTVE